MTKFHISGMKPCQICKIENLNTLIFRGEYGFIYEYNLDSQELRFLSENDSIKEPKDTELPEGVDAGFCGLLLAYAYVNDTEIICCSSEGTVHLIEKAERKWVIKNEMRVSWNRLISLAVHEDLIYVLSHTGNIFVINMLELRTKTVFVCLSSIWDMETDGLYLYCGSADSKLCVYDKKLLTCLKSFSADDGWINSIYKKYCCTSTGSIYKFDIENGLTQIYSANGKCWINDLCVIRDCMAAITAEGYLLELDLSGKLISHLKLSNNQLISVEQYENHVYAASVKGEVYVCDLTDRGITHLETYLLNINITYIHVHGDNLFVATTNGELCIIKLLQCLEFFQPKSFYAELISLSKSRIWKVKANENYIYAGSVAGELFRVCIENLHVEMYKVCQKITSMAINDDSVILGTREGKLYICNQRENEKRVIITERKEKLVLVRRWLDVEKHTCDSRQIKLHVCGEIDFNGRLIRFLKESRYKFQVIEHENKAVPEGIEWCKYPYLTFGDKFLAGGMLLDEFVKQGVIERLI